MVQPFERSLLFFVWAVVSWLVLVQSLSLLRVWPSFAPWQPYETVNEKEKECIKYLFPMLWICDETHGIWHYAYLIACSR